MRIGRPSLHVPPVGHDARHCEFARYRYFSGNCKRRQNFGLFSTCFRICGNYCFCSSFLHLWLPSFSLTSLLYLYHPAPGFGHLLSFPIIARETLDSRSHIRKTSVANSWRPSWSVQTPRGSTVASKNSLQQWCQDIVDCAKHLRSLQSHDAVFGWSKVEIGNRKPWQGAKCRA